MCTLLHTDLDPSAFQLLLIFYCELNQNKDKHEVTASKLRQVSWLLFLGMIQENSPQFHYMMTAIKKKDYVDECYGVSLKHEYQVKSIVCVFTIMKNI